MHWLDHADLYVHECTTQVRRPPQAKYGYNYHYLLSTMQPASCYFARGEGHVETAIEMEIDKLIYSSFIGYYSKIIFQQVRQMIS